MKRVVARDIELAAEVRGGELPGLRRRRADGQGACGSARPIAESPSEDGIARTPTRPRRRPRTESGSTPRSAATSACSAIRCDGDAALEADLAASADLSRLRHRLVAGGSRRPRLPDARQRGRVVPRGPRGQDRQGHLEGEPHGHRRRLGSRDGRRRSSGRTACGRRSSRSGRGARDQLRHGRPRAVAPQGHDAGDTHARSAGEGPALRGLRLPGRRIASPVRDQARCRGRHLDSGGRAAEARS